MHNFKELKVWQKARVLVKEVYQSSQKFPDVERFGLTSQIRRAVVSIPSNISEGCGRGTDKDFCRFLEYALASAYEVETQIILAFDLGFIDKNEVKNIFYKLEETQKMLFKLIKKFKKY